MKRGPIAGPLFSYRQGTLGRAPVRLTPVETACMSDFSTFSSISASCSLGATILIVRFSTACASPPGGRSWRAVLVHIPEPVATTGASFVRPHGQAAGRCSRQGWAAALRPSPCAGRAFGVPFLPWHVSSPRGNHGNLVAPPERRAPGTLLAAGRGIPNEMEFQVHFYDERGKAPLCGSPIPPPWGWTAKRANVTCPECLQLLTRLPPPSNDGRRAGR